MVGVVVVVLLLAPVLLILVLLLSILAAAPISTSGRGVTKNPVGDVSAHGLSV